MTFRAIDPAVAKIYYAEEADRPISTLNIPDGSLVIFTDSGLEDSFDSVANAWFNREQITQTSSGEAAGLVVVGDPPAVRNDGTSSAYMIAREECNGSILDASTAAQAVSGGAPAHLQGIIINTALVGTLTISGLTNVTGTVTDIVLAAATPVGFIDFKGVRCETALIAQLATATDDVVILWRPL